MPPKAVGPLKKLRLLRPVDGPAHTHTHTHTHRVRKGGGTETWETGVDNGYKQEMRKVPF